ncbi:uncharacterized protein LOC118434370 [Folsomia candida]|uniref:Uncharacterized protein n=1 Tax=Folsomia candida TaxID=158441 RepID=A0A226EY22_FOLCA|nr:uncharacterized protein LOC118434370 [Folsomia candida]OXA61984.1 hypothetical protein Fcan01_03366 [Folsomia candida]
MPNVLITENIRRQEIQSSKRMVFTLRLVCLLIFHIILLAGLFSYFIAVLLIPIFLCEMHIMVVATRHLRRLETTGTESTEEIEPRWVRPDPSVSLDDSEGNSSRDAWPFQLPERCYCYPYPVEQVAPSDPPIYSVALGMRNPADERNEELLSSEQSPLHTRWQS